jgi:hypothetical protein
MVSCPFGLIEWRQAATRGPWAQGRQSTRCRPATTGPSGSCSPSAAEAQRDQLERPHLEVDRRTLAGRTLGQRPL